MKKLLALTAIVGATTAVVTACGVDTLAQLENVKVEKLSNFTCTTAQKEEAGEQVNYVTVKMNYNWTAVEAGDYQFYAVVTDIKGAKLATKTVETTEATEGAKFNIEFSKEYKESAFFTCATLGAGEWTKFFTASKAQYSPK